MALKLNLKYEIEKEMESLLPQARVRSKTEYINQAVREYNLRLKRRIEVDRLKNYFHSYRKEGKAVLDEFARVRKNPD